MPKKLKKNKRMKLAAKIGAGLAAAALAGGALFLTRKRFGGKKKSKQKTSRR